LVLIHVTTVPETLNFFKGQIGYLTGKGFEIHAVSSPGILLEEVAEREKIKVHAIPMARKITPFKDIITLVRMFRLFRSLQPTLVHAHTPKAGLLGVLSARLAGVPSIIYTIHGLPFSTASGFRGWLLFLSEMLACRCAHHIFGVSLANMKLAVDQGVCPREKISIIAGGSVNGVDAETRFNRIKLASDIRGKIRRIYGIPEKALVIGYMGRIVRDKGIVELATVWRHLRSRYSDLHLILIGPEEPQDPIPHQTRALLKTDSRVIFTGFVRETAALYAAMDILVLPTYREGFPVVPLEAAAMQLPVVATHVDGCQEAVVDGITGLLVPPRDTEKLLRALESLIRDGNLRRRMGLAGRERVLRGFKPEIIWQELFRKYVELINQRRVSAGKISRLADKPTRISSTV
jgi:glycosyltransferase involved in cell wall biosynthesis